MYSNPSYIKFTETHTMGGKVFSCQSATTAKMFPIITKLEKWVYLSTPNLIKPKFKFMSKVFFACSIAPCGLHNVLIVGANWIPSSVPHPNFYLMIKFLNFLGVTYKVGVEMFLQSSTPTSQEEGEWRLLDNLLSK